MGGLRELDEIGVNVTGGVNNSLYTEEVGGDGGLMLWLWWAAGRG